MPGQKIGIGRTRVLLSNDDVQLGAFKPAKFRKDNYLQEELEDESDGLIHIGGTTTSGNEDDEIQPMNSDEGEDATIPQQIYLGVDTENHTSYPINLQEHQLDHQDNKEDDNESMIENNYGEGDEENPADDDDTEELGGNNPRSTVTGVNADVPFEESKQLSTSKDCPDVNDE